MKLFVLNLLFALSLLGLFNETMSLSVAEDKNQETVVLQDPESMSFGTTKWGEVNLNHFFSFEEWKNQIDDKALTPGWEILAKEKNAREVVGRFFQCAGTCRVDRGKSFFNPRYLTKIYEGDEVQATGDSYAWIFLLDGTMVRLSPESSIIFNEINIGVKENFFSARINSGNVLWLSRSESLYEELNLRETDVLFNPISLYEAIPIPDKKSYDESNLIEMVSEKQTVLNQYKNLNSLVEKNNKLTLGKPSYVFLIMPNASVLGYNPHVEIVSIFGGKSYIKNRSEILLGLKSNEEKSKPSELLIQKRGFENTDLTPLPSDKWMEVDETGRLISEATEHLYLLSMGEFVTKYIPSLLVARELMMTKYSEFAFREKYDASHLSLIDGYRLWGAISHESSAENIKQDLELRLDYIKEYFRRIETTNLLVSTHFGERLKLRGESIKAMEFGNYFFSRAIDRYYSYPELNNESENGEILNSTTKALWKHMHGIR